MNRMHLNDDIFSPVRFDTSVVDSSGNSDGSLTDFLSSSIVPSYAKDNKGTSNENTVQRQSKSVDQGCKSFSICSPVSTENPCNSLDNKFYSGSTVSNTDKEKHIEDNLLKESSEKFKPTFPVGIDIDCHVPKSNSAKQVNLKRRSNQIPSKDELVKHNVAKNEKQKQKNTAQSSKNFCNQGDSQISKSKLSAEKKLLDNSLNLTVNSSEKSIEPKESTTALISATVKPNNAVQEVGNVELAPSCPGPTGYEASIERMVHDCIKFESANLRQNMYFQQMGFYRQLNQVKNEMKQQHLATTQHLVKIIHELQQINNTLRSALNDKN